MYYLNDVKTHNINQILNIFDTLPSSTFQLNSIFLDSIVEFFGDEKDELVILISDPQKELLSCNETVKKEFHKANEQYKNINKQDLYNIAKSERYPYLPHIGLGRIRSTSIKTHIDDLSEFPRIFAKMQSRIKDVVSELLSMILTDNNKQLPIKKIGILDLTKRSYIKEYQLSQ